MAPRNIVAATMSAPDPALVARMQRLAQASPSPSVQAIAGFVLHGYRYLNPKLGDGLDLGDIVEGLQHAIACSQAAGNIFAEAICMTLAVIPLTDRGDRRDAAALRATLGRIHEIRYDFALIIARGAGGRLARPHRPADAASVVDGWLHSHVKPPYPPFLQPTLEQLDQLLDTSRYPAERARGAAMTPTELTEFLDDELTSIIGDDIADSA